MSHHHHHPRIGNQHGCRQHPVVRSFLAKVRSRRIQFERAGGTLAYLRGFMPDKYWQLRHCEWMLAGAIKNEAWEEVPTHAGGLMWTWENALRDLHKVRSQCWLEIHAPTLAG